MFYLPGKVIDTIEQKESVAKTYLSFSSYLKSLRSSQVKSCMIIAKTNTSAVV